MSILWRYLKGAKVRRKRLKTPCLKDRYPENPP